MRLTEETKQNAKYIGDGAYFEDQGWQVMIFASNGMSISNAVSIDKEDVPTLINYLNNYLKEFK